MTELKPCPFCGCEAYVESWQNGPHWVRCLDCGATIQAESSRDKAVDAWNRRHERTCFIAEDVDEVETELGPIEVRTYLCGECHGRMAPDDAHCPNCGARVVKEE